LTLRAGESRSRARIEAGAWSELATDPVLAKNRRGVEAAAVKDEQRASGTVAGRLLFLRKAAVFVYLVALLLCAVAVA